MPAATPFTPSSAIAGLIELIGPPQLVSAGLRVWEVDSEGDGIESVRLSSTDLQGGETALAQLEPVRRLTRSFDLRPRLVVVSFRNSGGRRYEDRPDLELIERSVRARWCNWVAFRGVDRIARDDLPYALFYDLLKQHGTTLYLAELGRAVNWSRDRIEVGLRGLISTEERETIKERTHGALVRNWVRAGRGWPSKRPFGFRRNEWTKFLEPDPEQWPYVKLIHYRYADLSDGRTGVRRLANELAEAGCDLSPTRIRAVLDDLIYVTGEYTFTHGGELIAPAPVVLPDPIPLEIWQRNQELLAMRKGKTSRTPEGYFCLNGIRLLHEPCIDERNGRGQRPVLKGRVHPGRSICAYRHEPWVPCGCRGFVVDQDVLEPPILGAIVAGVEEGPGVDAWLLANRDRGVSISPAVDEGTRRRVERQIGNLQRSRARLARSFRLRLAEGRDLDEMAYADLVAGIDTEIACLSEYLRRADEVDVVSLTPAARQPSGWRAAVRATLTPDVPDDARLRVQRAALVEALVDEVVVSDYDGEALRVEVRGPLFR
jgi:hypothetical protein